MKLFCKKLLSGMYTIHLINILILITLFRGTISGIPVRNIQSVRLQKMPYRLDDTYLLGLPFKQRRELCTKIRSKIDEFVFEAKYWTNVLPAHLFKFGTEDGTEEWLAIKCNTFPTMYISHERMEKGTQSDNHQWYVWMVRPNLDEYEFNIETAFTTIDAKNETTDLKARQTSIFSSMDQNMRWYFCDEARKRVRVEIDIEKEYKDGGPKFYEITYEDETKKIIFAIECFSSPKFYIHDEHKNSNEDKLITILLAYVYEKDEMEPTKNIVPNFHN